MYFCYPTSTTILLLLLLMSVGWCEKLPQKSVKSTPVQLDKSYGKLYKHNQCHYMLKHLQGGEQISVHMPPDITGHWVSESCEVRPGPEFLTRSYHFFSNHTFQALQFYYKDNHCTKPGYTLLIEGSLHPRQASWLVRGGTESDYQLSRVLLVSHSLAVAKDLQVKLETICDQTEHLEPDISYELWVEGSDRDCTHGLDFSMQELELLRVERRFRPNEPERQAEELFVGDVHTEHTQRRTHRPTGYQPPCRMQRGSAVYEVLRPGQMIATTNGTTKDEEIPLFLTYDNSCVACQIIAVADVHHPPVLPSRTDHPLHLYGNWVSKRCEVRPGVLFLTRHFVFHKESSIWEGHYYHYSDPVCRHPTFSISAKGHFSPGIPSTTVMGGTEFTFTVTQMKVNPMDVATTSLLNVFSGDECGKHGSWKLGVQQDVTPTSGCAALGIRLPHTEYELFYMGRDSAGHRLLFNGQRPTNGSSPDRPHRRATSYQPPLVHCSAAQKAIGKEGDHHFRLGNDGNSQHQYLVYAIIWVALAVIVI